MCNPDSANQRVLRLPLTYLGTASPLSVETDDTVFVTSRDGFLLLGDYGLNTVYRISKNAFAPGTAYTAADGVRLLGRST